MVNSRTLILGLLVGCALGVGVFCGCEDGPDTENVDSQFDGSPTTVDSVGTTAALMAITPATAIVTKNGQIVSFRVDGVSDNVSWSLQNHDVGTIVTQGDRTASYRRDAEGDNVIIVKDNSNGELAFATIWQNDTPAMSISPAAVTLATNDMTQVFSAANAQGALTWSVQPSTAGSISENGDSAIYTRTDDGNSVVSVTDANGTASAAVTQPL